MMYRNAILHAVATVICAEVQNTVKSSEKRETWVKKRKLLDVDAQKHQFLRTNRLPVHCEWMHEIPILLQGQGVLKQKRK